MLQSQERIYQEITQVSYSKIRICVTCHFRGSKPAGSSETQPKSIAAKIQAFEKTPDSSDSILRDGTRPKKKKPTSKAFEDFESKGIIIGFVSSWGLFLNKFKIHLNHVNNVVQKVYSFRCEVFKGCFFKELIITFRIKYR